MKVWYAFLMVICLTVVACSDSQEDDVDPLLRAHVDELNKNSFQARYQNPTEGVRLADSAMQLVRDSLPQYGNGYLRAANNRAYNSYMRSDFEDAEKWLVDNIDDDDPLRKASNYEVEKVISQLVRARMEQRHCNIAESYRILYEVDHSKTLQGNEDNFLYDFALMEYYITSLTLNYHYRNGALDNVELLLEEIEQTRASLRCDYAQDMALNYSMAHSYYKLCDSNRSKQALLLLKSMQYCFANLQILSRADRYSDYHFANVMQMLAFIGADTNISENSWQEVADYSRMIFSFITEHFEVTFDFEGDLTGQLFDFATDIYWKLDDPYQQLGAVVAAADYYVPLGNYAAACESYARVMNSSSLVNPVAPKFEAMLFAGLINAHYSDNPEDMKRWFNREMEVQQYIKQNEKADFILQQKLQESKQANRVYVLLLLAILITLIGLSITVELLRRRTRQLKEEKQELEETKRKDIERIANVETCLSVMRHDISPFISYLQNKNLPEELRKEVLSQLIRTFDNMKNWTNLSIPSGMQFQVDSVEVQQLFDETAGNCVAPLHETVKLTFHPTNAVVKADPHLVVILLRNLVNNALQHTDSGAVEVVAKSFVADARFVEITVSDTGVGMSAEEIDDLFRADKKIRAQATSPEGYGSGFGLILCRHIIKKHDDNTLRGCRLWADSEPGQGSVFHFLLERG